MVKLEEPDKGQAWVVAFASCIINMILSGISRMIGILYVAVLEKYGVTREEATLPFSVRNSIRCLSGPIVGVIGQRYGIRTVTFWGGVVAAAGAALCCIAPDITWLAVFWGGMHGCGFAFANTLFQVVVNQYFQKHRATASGIALSGACVGSFVFPLIIEKILNTFGLSGGFLLLAGIVMQCLPPSLLLTTPPWVKNPEKYARLKALKMQQESVETLDVAMPDKEPQNNDIEQELRDMVRSTSLSNCPIEDICSACKSCSNDKLAGKYENNEKCQRGVVCTFYRNSQSPPSGNKSASQNGRTTRIDGTKKTEIPTISSGVSSETIRSENHETSFSTKKDATLLDSVKTMINLYTNPVFVLISLCMSTYIIIFIPMLTVIVDYSMDKGLPQSDGKYLLNAMALGDLIGRLCFGWVTDRNIITIPVFMTICLVLEGIIIVLFPLAASLYTFILLLALYGVTAGTILIHFPLLIFKYVDYDAQSVAIGCEGVFSGIISFAIPPMIGHFRDKVGSYDGMFYLIGAISVISGVLWLFEPLMVRYFHKTDTNNKLQCNLKSIEFLENNSKLKNTANSNELKPS